MLIQMKEKTDQADKEIGKNRRALNGFKREKEKIIQRKAKQEENQVSENSKQSDISSKLL